MWPFFDEAIPAALARRLGSHLLTETMERRPDVGLDSYDRLFPNQDTMPHGGFGNLIALPLQKRPRGQGHSVFLDDHLMPYADQWAFLASVRKIGRGQVDQIVEHAERHGRVLSVRLPPRDDGEEEPWTAPPSRRGKEPPIVGDLPPRLELVLGNQIYIDECHHLSAHSFERVARQAKARFVVGLAATVARKDGHHPIIFMQCGPVRHRVNARAQAATRPFEHLVLVQPTAFQPSREPESDKRVEFQALYQQLVDDEPRNRTSVVGRVGALTQSVDDP